MEAQEHTEPITSRAALLRPPTGSPVAALPTETLAQILNALLQGLKPWARHQPRLAFALICTRWCTAAELGKEVAVEDSFAAERLTDSLKRDGKAQSRAKRVRTLYIRCEEKGGGRAQRVGKLISTCRELRALELHLVAGLVKGEDPLSRRVSDALMGLHELDSFVLASKHAMALDGGLLSLLLGSWSKIRTLALRNVTPKFDRLLMRSSLVSLELPFSAGRPCGGLPDLLRASRETLRHLTLTHDISAAYSAPAQADAMHQIIALAPRLLSFTNRVPFHLGFAVHVSTHLDPTVAALRDVQSLSLSAVGIDFSAILPLLQPLQHLCTLSIADKHLPTSYQPFQDLSASSASTFIAHAPALRSLTIPHQVEAVWTEAELAEVQEAAEKCGIIFRLS